MSNHGGRSMDYGPSTLEVLPEIVAAVNGRVPVITDSGYRRGTDILKALALGASAVLLGRTPRWALGAFGAPGVQRLLEIMQRELVDAAAAAGRRTLASIDSRSSRRTSRETNDVTKFFVTIDEELRHHPHRDPDSPRVCRRRRARRAPA